MIATTVTAGLLDWTLFHLVEDSIFSSGRLWKHAAYLTSKAPLSVGESDGVSHHRGGCQ